MAIAHWENMIKLDINRNKIGFWDYERFVYDHLNDNLAGAHLLLFCEDGNKKTYFNITIDGLGFVSISEGVQKTDSDEISEWKELSDYIIEEFINPSEIKIYNTGNPSLLFKEITLYCDIPKNAEIVEVKFYDQGEIETMTKQDQGDIWADDILYKAVSNDDIWYEPDKENDKFKEIEWTYYGKPIDKLECGDELVIWRDKGVFECDVYDHLRNKIEKLYKIPVLEDRYGLSVEELIRCIIYGLSPNFKTPFDIQIYLAFITSKKEFKRNILKDPGVLYQIAMYKRVKV